jgi:CheY-like chemotaxis protein
MIFPEGRTPRVLLVDDEPDIFFFIKTFNEVFKGGFELFYADCGTRAIEMLNDECFDGVILDMRLPGLTGACIGDLIREHDPNIPMAYLTNLDTEEARRQAVSARAFFWLKYEMLSDQEALHKLITLIAEIVQLNPCVEEGVKRMDNRGHPRRLPRTPIVIPSVLKTLAAHQTRFG